MLFYINLMFVYLGSKNPAETSGRSCLNVLETSMNLYTNCKYKVYHESCYNTKMLKRLKLYFLKNGRKVIKQEVEQLKVNELNITKCLRRIRTSLLTHKNFSQTPFILTAL